MGEPYKSLFAFWEMSFRPRVWKQLQGRDILHAMLHGAGYPFQSFMSPSELAVVSERIMDGRKLELPHEKHVWEVCI